MQPINIHDLKNFSPKLILEFLADTEGSAFEIHIPPEQVDPDDYNFSIFWMYHTAAYSGQQLHNIAETFSYFVPCPGTKENFFFRLTVNDKRKLAHCLAFIISGYFDNDTEMLRFNEESAKYFTDSFDGETDAATWGLLTIANDYLCKST
jgi:hypothetical protein